MQLEAFGWDAGWADRFTSFARQGLAPARVIVRHNHVYEVAAAAPATEVIDLRAEAAGKLRHAAAGAHELPAVGDWVAVQPPAGAGTALIHAVLPRRSRFSRKAAGRATEEQVVAANIDTVLLMAGLDNDFSPRRVERYLVMAWESGAAPVVVLNKADLCADVPARLAEIDAVAAGVPVRVTSALLGEGLDALAPCLGRGRTVALLGSSGVGKSTLINRLLGADRLPTLPVRAHDSRGRHTTTHRQLLLLPGGGMVIDTPGMRELQLWDSDEGLHVTFDEIETLARACRFSDCSHVSEPGCAVLAAVAAGTLDAARLANFHKMGKELAWLDRKQDKSAELAEKKRWKAIHKAARQLYRNR